MRIFGFCVHRWHYWGGGYRRTCANAGCKREQIYTHPDGQWEDVDKVKAHRSGPLTVK